MSGTGNELNLKKTILGARARKTGGGGMKKEDIEFHNSVTFMVNTMVTGTNKGELHTWSGNTSKAREAHVGQIYCMKMFD